ncbi:MAG: RNA polymerase sigma-70 factor [Pseudomonadota bacterium]
MDDKTRFFDRLRPRLQGIAYRMLGSTAEAEEVVQDAWLRWHETAQAALDSGEAWLVTVTTRLAIDRLRAAKVQRAHYAGLWLPEPMLTGESPPSPEQMLERADDLSVAFLTLLERLAPEARAAFLLREVFDVDYGELAHTLGKSEAACRQMVHRAKAQLADARPRPAVPRETQQRLLRGFAEAVGQGDFAALQSMLAEDAELVGDGGGKVTSFPKPLLGGRRIAQLFYASHRRFGDGQRVVLAEINGQWGLLRFIHGALESAQSYQWERGADGKDGAQGERIVRILVQRNPDKLARLAAAARGV